MRRAGGGEPRAILKRRGSKFPFQRKTGRNGGAKRKRARATRYNKQENERAQWREEQVSRPTVMEGSKDAGDAQGRATKWPNKNGGKNCRASAQVPRASDEVDIGARKARWCLAASLLRQPGNWLPGIGPSSIMMNPVGCGREDTGVDYATD